MGRRRCAGLMLRALVLAALFALGGVTLTAEPVQANHCGDAVPPVGAETKEFVCGRIDCIAAGLPNIMVTCL